VTGYALDLIAGATWILVTVAFVVARSLVRPFIVFCAAMLALVLAACLSGAAADRGADSIAIVAGFVLYCFGLLILRVILNRSISLDLLVRSSRGQLEPMFADHLTRRLDDARKYRLVRTDAGVCTLSRRGIALERVLALAYRLTGQE
jgi:hypothetical protein